MKTKLVPGHVCDSNPSVKTVSPDEVLDGHLLLTEAYGKICKLWGLRRVRAVLARPGGLVCCLRDFSFGAS